MPVLINKFSNFFVKNSTYVDLHLDLEDEKKSNTVLFDIKADMDVDAVKNSLRNIFNTNPGQKILNPAFGLNLKKFLFEPVSEGIGRRIGHEINSGIIKSDSRISVRDIKIVAKPDENLYEIFLAVAIPSLNIQNLNLSGVLKRESFLI